MQPEVKTTAELSEARRALLKRYLRGGMARVDTKPATIPKRNGSRPALLSYGQQQIWLDSQLAGESLIYNEPVTIHRRGELDILALERSFAEIVRRHEAWRTTFRWEGDQVVQIIHPAPARIEIPFIDLRGHPQPDREREAIRLATEDALQSFDLARGPLYRPRLVRLGDAEHRLFLTLHHIIFDGVSLYRVFLPELQTLYEAFAKNESPVLSELPIQYPDYAVWQRDSIQQIPPEQLPYWKAVCDDLPVLNLRTDHPRPAAHTYTGAMVTLQISSSTTAALKIFSQKQGATTFMTMVASFMALLHGYTGQEDIVIGTAGDGRNHIETESLLGFFLNTIVIRCAFSKELPFTELLKRVRSATLGALSHDAVPFELLVQKFAGKRDPSRGSLFQVLISIEPPLTPLKDGWAFTQMDVETGTAKFDLHLELDDRAEGLIGRFIYNTDLFERETIKLLKSRWLQLLDRIAAAPTQRVRDLTAAVWREAKCEAPSRNTAGDAERQKLLVDWNDLEQQLSYWRKQLAGLPVLELPTDRPRPPAQSFRGARHSIVFSKSLTEGLRELSRREGATLYMTLLAAFQALLVRYTGQEDIVVGSPIANRTRVEIEGLIGFFINTLVLRTDLSGDPTFRELLKRVREVALGAYAHQDLTFEKLVEELKPERDLSQNPLFQVLFALQNAPACSFELAGLEVIPLPVGSGTTHFDLEVYVGEKPGGLTCTFIYATDLFDAGTIVRMMGHYQTLLEGIVTDANRRVSEVAIITEPERRQVVEEWNQTEREYPREKTVHGLFEEQAERTPRAEAVVFGRERLSYAELNERANRLARYLRKRGVGPEVLVGLCVERSLEMVVGLLGILKAGGAYLPLDPGYPQQRLGFMLQDSDARVVLTQESLSGSLAEGGFERVCLDSDWPEIARESAENPKPLALPDNLAYVIYTSGSTGTPKGVEIEHHSTVALLAWTRQLFSDEELGGVLASTSVCFDLSVFELFAPLAWGGKVIVSRGALELPELRSAEEVKLINTVPSAMAELLRIGALPESVSTINLAGEPLTASLVNEILRSGEGRQVFDLYGPTEDTTYSTCARRSAEGPVTIGRPISNKRVYILDGRLQPVPIGVAGDLYVAGAGVARGYLNRPEMTAEKFLADPFREGGERMYRTGDRGRFLSDGQIQFLGRTDHQVKIRGYRIEVGEIEQALARHPEIQACIVAARDEPSGDKRLVGYIVPRKGSSPSVTQLRGFLKSTLPDYMVPSAFLFLDALPLTPNGKVDRRALPAPEDGRPALEDVFIAPRTPIEETVAGIWCQVLGLEKVGVHDNFFDLGGHSLLAVQLVAKIEKQFGRQIALATIFRAPTVGELAQMFGERRRKGRRSPSLVAIQPKGTRPPFFCVHANTGIPYYRRLARLLGPDQPFYGLQSQGLDGGRAPYETVEEMAAHYVSEVRAVQPQGPYYLGGYSFGGKVAFEMARQLWAQGQRTAFLALLDTFNIPVTPRPTRLEIARERTRVHLAALRTGGRRERLTYLLARTETLRSLLGRALSRGYEVLFQPLRRAQLRVLDANTRAARRYVASYYEGKATIFRATDRTKDFRDRLRTYPFLGWEKLCSEGVDVHEVPGGHSSLMEEEANLKALAEKLRECLREAWTAESAETAARPGRRVNAAAKEA